MTVALSNANANNPVLITHRSAPFVLALPAAVAVLDVALVLPPLLPVAAAAPVLAAPGALVADACGGKW